MRKYLLAILVALLTLTAAAPLPRAAETPTITVLTFNVWGIIGAKERLDRMEAIGRKIAALNPDVVAVQEAFEYRHRDALLAALDKAGYEYADWKYFRHHVYGSGVMLISRYPVEETVFEPYRVNSTWTDIERAGGKGIAYARLGSPYGPLDFFLTHALARMDAIFDDNGEFIPGDRKQIDRILQMYQIDLFINTHKGKFSRSIIAAGDFNVSPEMLEYRFLTALTGFESSFETLHPGENPSTFSRDNTWVTDDFSRIDHIFYKNYPGSSGFWVTPVESRIEFTDRFTEPDQMRLIDYSDHYGLLTVFNVTTDQAPSLSPEGVKPPNCPGGECSPSGYEDGVITLTGDNYRAWQFLALGVLREAYLRKDRENQLVLAMAEVIEAGEVTGEVVVVVPQEARPKLEAMIENGCPALAGQTTY